MSAGRIERAAQVFGRDAGAGLLRVRRAGARHRRPPTLAGIGAALLARAIAIALTSARSAAVKATAAGLSRAVSPRRPLARHSGGVTWFAST